MIDERVGRYPQVFVKTSALFRVAKVRRSLRRILGFNLGLVRMHRRVSLPPAMDAFWRENIVAHVLLRLDVGSIYSNVLYTYNSYCSST